MRLQCGQDSAPEHRSQARLRGTGRKGDFPCAEDIRVKGQALCVSPLWVPSTHLRGRFIPGPTPQRPPGGMSGRGEGVGSQWLQWLPERIPGTLEEGRERTAPSQPL